MYFSSKFALFNCSIKKMDWAIKCFSLPTGAETLTLGRYCKSKAIASWLQSDCSVFVQPSPGYGYYSTWSSAIPSSQQLPQHTCRQVVSLFEQLSLEHLWRKCYFHDIRALYCQLASVAASFPARVISPRDTWKYLGTLSVVTLWFLGNVNLYLVSRGQDAH